MAILLAQPSTLAAGVAALTATYVIGRAIYNVFFHPLRAFPGPISHAISELPYCYRLLRGTLPLDMLGLHEEYGDVVRIAPNELAFSHPDAWKDIMGHQPTGTEELSKWKNFYRPFEKATISIVSADREEHAQLRRQLSHGFSERSMRDQEPIVKGYIDLLIRRLHEHCAAGAKSLDMAAWYNYTTFDIIGDLAFGKPFGSLETSQYHPFIPLLLQSTQLGTILICVGFYPLLKSLFLAFVPKSMMEKFDQRREIAFATLLERMKVGNERNDLIEGLLRKKDELGLDLDRLEANSTILLIGGSETTATLLSGVTYLLLMHPEVLERLTDEVRTTFSSEDDIDLNSVNKLTYMLACLNEALRLYPPAPAGLPRVVPKGGRRILGRYVAEDAVVAIHHWAAYHNEKHFTDPFKFHPERFLGDERYANDQFEVLQPFNVGPRNCIGRNLAYTEMRLILARIIYNFDMRLAPESIGWMERQKVYLLWDKPPLQVHLTPVR